MNVLAINASPHKNKGNTPLILSPFHPQDGYIKTSCQRFSELIESRRNRTPGLAGLIGGSG
ncbi:MAG: hypothetical protein WC379_04520 [Methanoregula sp.]